MNSSCPREQQLVDPVGGDETHSINGNQDSSTPNQFNLNGKPTSKT